jgi:hypothetical protein
MQSAYGTLSTAIPDGGLRQYGKSLVKLAVVGTILAFCGLLAQYLAQQKFYAPISETNLAVQLMSSGFISLCTLLIGIPFALLTKSDLRFLSLKSVLKLVLACFCRSMSALFSSRAYCVPVTILELTNMVPPLAVVMFTVLFIRNRSAYHAGALGAAAILCVIGVVVASLPDIVNPPDRFSFGVSKALAAGWGFSVIFSNIMLALYLALAGSFVQCALTQYLSSLTSVRSDVNMKLLGAPPSSSLSSTPRIAQAVTVCFGLIAILNAFSCLFFGLTPIWNAIPNLGPADFWMPYSTFTTSSVSEGYDGLRRNLALIFQHSQGFDYSAFATMYGIGMAVFMIGFSFTCLTSPLLTTAALLAAASALKIMTIFPYWSDDYMVGDPIVQDRLSGSEWAALIISIVFYGHAAFVAVLWGVKIHVEGEGLHQAIGQLENGEGIN